MKANVKAAVGWELVELVRRPSANAGYVVSEPLIDAGVIELKHVRREMRILRAAGVPPERTLGSPDVECITFRCPNAHNLTEFWELKCKPSQWRFYFVVHPTLPRAIFLHTVAKKKNKRDEKHDLSICCTRLSEYFELIRAGTSCLSPLDEFL